MTRDEYHAATLIERVTGDKVPGYLHEYFIQRVFFHMMKADAEDPNLKWTSAILKKLVAKAVVDCVRKGRH